MTTPGGVPNLPMGALTVDTMGEKLQDMSGAAMKSRAVERFPSIFSSSTGADPALDITPFGILTRLFAEANSSVANADPADIQGPDDLPAVMLRFITDLPVVDMAESMLNMLGSYLGIPNLGVVLQKLALLPSILLSAATGENPSGGNDDTILQDLFDALRGIFGGGTPGEDPTDVTPPTAPSLTLNSATYSTVTVTASGAVDPP